MDNQQALAVRTEMQQMSAAIDNKLKALKEVTDSQYKTNGEYRFAPGFSGNIIDIHKSTDVRLLLGIVGALTNHKTNYENAAKMMGLDTYPEFLWLKYNYGAWTHDIKVRLAVITHYDTKKKLEEAKKELEQFMTQEDRLALVLEKMKGLI